MGVFSSRSGIQSSFPVPQPADLTPKPPFLGSWRAGRLPTFLSKAGSQVGTFGFTTYGKGWAKLLAMSTDPGTQQIPAACGMPRLSLQNPWEIQRQWNWCQRRDSCMHQATGAGRLLRGTEVPAHPWLPPRCSTSHGIPFSPHFPLASPGCQHKDSLEASLAESSSFLALVSFPLCCTKSIRQLTSV